MQQYLDLMREVRETGNVKGTAPEPVSGAYSDDRLATTWPKAFP